MVSDLGLGDDRPGRVVRPYVATRGRTEADDLRLETMVVARPARSAAFADESRRIVEACDRPMAVAELAARVDLPLGIVRVLVADLLAGGSMEAYDTAAPDDATIVRRILDAIRPT